MDKIFISVTIPTYKRVNFLKEAIDSALKQKGKICRYEVVVVDNEPKSEQVESETYKLIQTYDDPRLKYIQNDENLGMIGNWNKCLHVAKGQWVAMLHDDDLLDENYISRIEYYLKKYPYAGCIIPNHRDIDQNGILLKNKKNRRNSRAIVRFKKNSVIKPKDIDDKILTFNYYGCPSCGMIVRKKYALDIGGYDQSVGQIFADWDFYLKMRHKHPVYKLNEILGSYRWAVNYSLTLDQRKKQEADELCLCIDRSFGYMKFWNSKVKESWMKLMKDYAYFDSFEKEKQWKLRTYLGAKNISKLRFVILALFRRIYMYFRCI